MSDEAEGQPKPAPAPGPRTSKLVVLLLLLNVGGTGFVGFKTLELADAAAHAAPHPGAEKEEEKKTDEVGPVTPLEPFIVNLNEPDASRYLKASFELEVAAAEVIGQLEKMKRPVRDEVLRYLSSLSVADTQGEKGKSKIQQEVVARIDRLLGGDKVRRLFFVEFVVQ
jgi:flagellar protein FliL